MGKALVDHPPKYLPSATEQIAQILDNKGILFGFVAQRLLKLFSYDMVFLNLFLAMTDEQCADVVTVRFDSSVMKSEGMAFKRNSPWTRVPFMQETPRFFTPHSLLAKLNFRDLQSITLGS